MKWSNQFYKQSYRLCEQNFHKHSLRMIKYHRKNGHMPMMGQEVRTHDNKSCLKYQLHFERGSILTDLIPIKYSRSTTKEWSAICYVSCAKIWLKKDVEDMLTTKLQRYPMTYIVRLNEWWCDIGEFQAIRVPCPHLIVVCSFGHIYS